MSDQMDPKVVIERMLDDAKSTSAVRHLIAVMGQQLFLQMPYPVAVFKSDGHGWSPTGQFTNVCQGIIQPCPIADRVLIIMPNNTGAFVKADDIQAMYLCLQAEEKSPLIIRG
jgi:hypothetical protein